MTTLAAGVKDLKTVDEAVTAPLVEEAQPLATRPAVMRESTRQASAAPAAAAEFPLSYRHSEDFGELMMALAAAFPRNRETTWRLAAMAERRTHDDR